MAITALDTHQTVKDLTAAGFSASQAEALTQALRRVQDIDLSNLATKADLADLRGVMKADLGELKSEMPKWFIGVAFAQAAMVLAIVKLFTGGHP